MKTLLLLSLIPLALLAQVEVDTVIESVPGLSSLAHFVPELNKLYVNATYRVIAFDCSTWQVTAQFPTSVPPGSGGAVFAWNPLRRKLYVTFHYHLDSMLVIYPDADSARWIPFNFRDIEYVGSKDLLYATTLRGSAVDLSALDCAADSLVKTIQSPVPGYSVFYVSWDSVHNRVFASLFALNRPGYLAVYDVATDSLLELLALDCLSPMKLNFHHRLHKAYFISEVGFGASGRAGVIDLDSFRLIKLFPVRAAGEGLNRGPVAVNTLMNKVYFGGNTGSGPLPNSCTLLVVDCTTDSVIKNIVYRGRGSRFYVAWVPWSNRVYFTADEASHMTVIDCRNDSVIVPKLILPGQMFSAFNVLLDPIRERIFAFLFADTTMMIYVLRDVISGMTESPEQKQAEPLGPTVLTSAQLQAELRQDSILSLFDASGREVLRPNSIPRGIYFVRRPTADSRQLTASRKVLVTD